MLWLRMVAALLVLFLVATLSACGAPRLEPEVPAGVNLAGAWRLNAQASEDPQVLIGRLQEKFQKRMPRIEDEPEGMHSGPGGNGGPGGATGARPAGSAAAADGGYRERLWPGGFLRSRYRAALGDRLSGESVVIQQSPDRFVIVRGDSRRSYTPGGHSVVSVADGVADQTSGWKGREYVIDVRPQVGPNLTERYGLSADGKLVEKVTLSESGLPKLEFTRVYEPGTAPARSLPTSN